MNSQHRPTVLAKMVSLTWLVEVMEFQLSYFKSEKMMLWKCCTQCASEFGKLSSGHRTGKGQFSFQSQRKAMPKNVQTTIPLHSSHMLVKYAQNSPSQASTVCEPRTSDVQARFRKGRGTRDQIANIRWLIEKARRVSEKRLLLFYWLCQSLWLCESQKTGKFFKRWEYQTALPASWETCMQVKKSQLEPDMEQQTGSK